MIKILVRNRLYSLFGYVVGRGKGGTVKKASTAQKIAVALLYLFVAAIFASFSAGMAYLLGSSLLPIGADWLYFAIFILASLAIVFVFSVFETKNELFEGKDNELLLSMPIKPGDIVASRVLVVLIYNYIEELIIMLPCIIVYIVYSPSVNGVLGSILMTFFLPLIATALSSGVGYAVALISQKLKKNSFVTVAISLAFLLVYFVGYNAVFENLESFLSKVQQDGGVSDMPFLYYIGSAALLKPASIFVIIALAIILSVAAYALISKSYIGIATDTSSGKRAAYKGGKFKQKSALWALIVKEMRKFISSATYMLNAGLGFVFSIALSVYAVFNRKFILNLAAEFAAEGFEYSFAEIISPLAIVVLVFMTSMSIMSACSLSLEGKKLWILKTVPITSRTVLLSKALPQIIISTPPTLISSILLIIATGAPLEYWFFFILTPFFANAFTAFFGAVINVAFPKFDFDNEAQPIKQSLSVFLVMMLTMLISVLAFVGTILLIGEWNPLLISALVFALYAILTAVFYLILIGPSARKYERIDA